MRARRNELEAVRAAETNAAATAPERQKGTLSDEWAARLAGGATYVPVRWLSRAVVALHFRRPTARRRERFPAVGATLLVANHPAAWTDVIVLESVFPRRLHFLAQERLFHPLPRAWLLRLHGALPVTTREDAPDAPDRNQETFRRCAELLARGEVVALFPEGRSGPDRGLGPLRSGAARIALDALRAGLKLAVVPVGIHYADRTAFRGEVVVQVGRPLPLEPLPGGGLEARWIERLTATIRRGIRGLLVEMPEPTLRPMVDEVAALLPAGPGGDPGAFGRSRLALRRLAARRRSPDWPCWERRIRRCVRLRRSAGLVPGDLEAAPPAARRVAALALGAAPALLGGLLHAPVALLADRAARRYREPERVALARIVAGMVCGAAWYLGGGALAARAMGAGAAAALGVTALLLGWIAVRESDSWPTLRGRLHLGFLARRHPAALARLRRERQTLRQWLDPPVPAAAPPAARVSS